MLGIEVQLYAILRDGKLNQYPKVTVMKEKDMPSGGALSNPADAAVVKGPRAPPGALRLARRC